MEKGTISSAQASDIRKRKYRKLIDQVEVLCDSEQTGLTTSQALGEIIQKAEKLFLESDIEERVEHTDEVLLDAKLIHSTSSVLQNVTDAIEASVDSYEPDDLAKRIRKLFLTKNDDFNYQDISWKKLFPRIRSVIKNPPEFSHLSSFESNQPIAPEKPPKEKRARKTKADKQEFKKEPEKLSNIDKEEDSVDDTVKFLQWALNKECEESGKRRINYFMFTIDPKNFSRSIENCFHLSFLVRDGRVQLETGKNGMLYLLPVPSKELKRAKKESVPYKQCILSIDIDIWKKAIETFEIKSSFLDKWKNLWDQRKKKK